MLAWFSSGVLVTRPFRHQVALLVLVGESLVKFSKRMCLSRQLSSYVCAGHLVLLHYFTTFVVSSQDSPMVSHCVTACTCCRWSTELFTKWQWSLSRSSTLQCQPTLVATYRWADPCTTEDHRTLLSILPTELTSPSMVPSFCTCHLEFTASDMTVPYSKAAHEQFLNLCFFICPTTSDS